ncbi:tetratricopeptide repeat protein [Flavobacterium rhizosphaerae]|uniref:Tetratricopeptide repeat protein n=1 Tax=Flavobacterium rhizosphaerae TaxID=3163298 RepID=A0ABW8Z2N0_9FLAO
MAKCKKSTLLLLIWITTAAYTQTKEECDSLTNLAVKEIFQQADYPSAIRHLKTAQAAAKKYHYGRQYFLATNNLGAACYQMLDYGNAIRYYLDAYNIAIANNEPLDEMSVLNNIAIVYAREENRVAAKEYFEKSYKIARKQNIKSRISLYASNIAKLSFEEGDFATARQYAKDALENVKDNPAVTMNTETTLLEILFVEKKYTEVVVSSRNLITIAHNNNLRESESELQLLLSKALLEMGDTGLASVEIDKGLQNAANEEFRLDFFELESKLALITHNITALYNAKDSIVKLNNYISINKNREILENSRLQFELASSNHELEINREKSASQKKLYIISTIFLVLVLLVFGWAFYKKNQVAKQKKELAESNLKIADLELERERQKTNILNQKMKEKELLNELEKEKLRDKQRKLKHEIEERNRQLSDKILFQTTRNELIEDIIEKVAGLPQVKNDEQMLRSVNSLKSHLKEDARWDEFTSNFENVNSDFLLRLKKSHPEINANDVRFLSFVYLNLSSKEIASLLNISPESSRKRKERISKKIGVPSGESLYNYLSTL